MTIPVASYAEQCRAWPQAGRHILAHFDAETIVVYQAYAPAIGHFAVRHGHFGGEFKYTRDELDQAKIPVDDVPQRLGSCAGAGCGSRDSVAAGVF